MKLGTIDVADLGAWLRQAAQADELRFLSAERLSGGAIQENWALDLEFDGGPFAGMQELVVRTDAPSGVSVSHSREHEFAFLEAAFEAGVAVPEPLFLCSDESVVGKPFYVMRRAAGTAIGQKIVKDPALGGDRDALTFRLGQELAKIHTITPATHGFPFLSAPDPDPASQAIAEFYGHLDALGRPVPVLDWGLRWLQRHKPCRTEVVLAHHDFRTGNYMVDDNGLTAILDWEFAGWSDPHEDIAWFCAACWRFGQRQLEAGGIGSREAFYAGYQDQSNRVIDPEAIYFWEVFAHVRWAVIAFQQGARHLEAGEDNLDLALTGRRPPEMEMEILRMTEPGKGAAP